MNSGGRIDSGALQIARLTESDREWLAGELRRLWHSTIIVSRGVVHRADELSGLVARSGVAPLGLLTYALREEFAEVVTLNSYVSGRGVGSALLLALQELALRSGWRRLWLTTTNDNTAALRFYQKRGWRLVAFHAGAIDDSRRRLKPEIPLLGDDGIPMHDELELEFPLNRPTAGA